MAVRLVSLCSQDEFSSVYDIWESIIKYVTGFLFYRIEISGDYYACQLSLPKPKCIIYVSEIFSFTDIQISLCIY